jgi:hypothetical protein
MSPSDLAELQERIDTALAASAEEYGSDERPDDAHDAYVVDFESTACHLVTHDDTRAALTDPAVRKLGGRQFQAEADGEVIRIRAMDAPSRARPPQRVWSSETGEYHEELAQRVKIRGKGKATKLAPPEDSGTAIDAPGDHGG